MKFKALMVFLFASVLLFQLAAAPKKGVPPVKADLDLTAGISLEAAVMKLLPKKSQLVHSITEGIFGPADGSMGPNINVVYRIPGKTPEIMILTPVDNGKYRKLKPAVLNFGGKNEVEVMSVFFDQADRDGARELFVLCYVSNKKESKYATAVFDWTGKEFKRMPKIEAGIKDAYPAINVRRALREIQGL